MVSVVAGGRTMPRQITLGRRHGRWIEVPAGHGGRQALLVEPPAEQLRAKKPPVRAKPKTHCTVSARASKPPAAGTRVWWGERKRAAVVQVVAKPTRVQQEARQLLEKRP